MAGELNSKNPPNRLPEIFLAPFRVDEVSSTLIYLGYVDGQQIVDETEPIWRIRRIRQVGTVWITDYANGDSSFNNIWDDRALLIYA